MAAAVPKKTLPGKLLEWLLLICHCSHLPFIFPEVNNSVSTILAEREKKNRPYFICNDVFTTSDSFVT